MKNGRCIGAVCVVWLSLLAVQSVWAGQTIELSVARKDTLSGICQRYLDRPEQWPAIAKINKLRDPYLILPGQRLVIPARMLKGTPLQGVTTFVKGDVQVRNAGDTAWSDLTVNQSIPEKSRIRTGSDGLAEIAFNNGNTIFQKQDTELGVV